MKSLKNSSFFTLNLLFGIIVLNFFFCVMDHRILIQYLNPKLSIKLKNCEKKVSSQHYRERRGKKGVKFLMAIICLSSAAEFHESVFFNTESVLSLLDFEIQ